jgi:hypothetical protein
MIPSDYNELMLGKILYFAAGMGLPVIKIMEMHKTSINGCYTRVNLLPTPFIHSTVCLYLFL